MNEYRDKEYLVTSNGDGSITFPTTRGPQRMFPAYIEPVPDAFQKQLRDRGLDPENYIDISCNTVVRKGAQPVIETALAIQRDQADRAAENREQMRLERRQRALAALPAGHELCKRNWKNGDLMSAEYESEDGAKVLGSDLLEGLAGTEWFAIPTAELNAQREKDRASASAAAQEKAAADAEFADKLAEARGSGKPVVLRTWVTERCMNRHEDECSFDIATQWVRPNGSTKVTYVCCF